MRVLILRPEPDGSRLAQRLTGHDCIVSPLLEIVACKTPPPIPHPTALALTSRQAAAPAFRPDWADTPLYAIGPGTAQAARDAGFTAVVHSGDGHALHLRDQLLEARPERILWPSGAHIRYDLAAGLAPLTAARWIVYEARPQTLTATAQAALAGGAVDWVLLTSPRLGRLFAGQTTGFDLSRTRLGCMSEAVARVVRPLGAGEVRVSRLPTLDNLLFACGLLCESDIGLEDQHDSGTD